MKTQLKSFLKALLNLASKTSLGRFIENTLIDNAMEETIRVNHEGCQLIFTTPNPLTRWRAQTFSNKEPETLEWIEGMKEGAVLWDIGANVGLYSIYAAKQRQMRVFGFKPSEFKLELLGRNCAINDVTDRVTIVPLALSDKTGPNLMRHTFLGWGGALSSFGAPYGADGKKLDTAIKYTTLGISADALVAEYQIPQPDYIKIDVDGIEHLILAGAEKTIQSAQSILVEINTDFTEQATSATSILKNAGFKLTDSQVSVFTDQSEANHVENQIWVKSSNKC